MSKAKITPVFEVQEPEQMTEQKVDEREGNNCIGDLNPRYFERVMTLKQAKQQNIAKYAQAKSLFSYF